MKRRILYTAGPGLLLLLAAAGCGGSGENGDGDGSVDGSDPAGDGGGCQSTSECTDGRVCDPVEHVCVRSLDCEGHEDCGKAAYCTTDGVCAPNTAGGPCATDDNCVQQETCVGGVCGCGGELYSAENVPPNVLIVLDRSTSMNDDIGGGTKWEIARDAIAQVLAGYGDQVLFGMMLYPGLDPPCDEGMECGPGAVFIDPGPGTESAINDLLATAQTCSFGTPTAEALQVLVTYGGLQDTTRANYILLVTDGQSTCEDPVPVVTSLAGASPEVRTFIVGFGSSVDPDELNDMATAGETAIPAGPPYYYQADDAASLLDAFTAIAGSVLSCSYTLSDVPPDPDQLYVYFDGVEVLRDAACSDGWDYDPATNQLVFCGPACDALVSGSVSDLVISYGCPVIFG